MKNNFNDFIELAERNPNTRYSLIFAPYSSIWWLLMEQCVDLDKVLAFKRHVIEKSANHPNIQIFDFQTDEKHITNLDHYQDYFHFTEPLTLYILQSIKEQKNIINTQNIDNIYKIKDILPKERAKYSSFVRNIIDHSSTPKMTSQFIKSITEKSND